MQGTTVFIDFETGGTAPEHPNIEFAALAVGPAWQRLEALDLRIEFDEARCDPKALETCRYADRREQWSQRAVSEAVAAARIESFLGRHKTLSLVSSRSGNRYLAARLAGHNALPFDAPRLKALMDRHLNGRWWPGAWWDPLDTRQLAQWVYASRPNLRPPDHYRLDDLGAHLGLRRSGEAHTALSDVHYCADVARALLELAAQDPGAARSSP